MSRKKNKNYRRQIEALRAQLSSQSGSGSIVTSPKAVVNTASDKVQIYPKQDTEIPNTSIEIVKKDVTKSLLFSIICFSIIIAAYIIQK